MEAERVEMERGATPAENGRNLANLRRCINGGHISMVVKSAGTDCDLAVNLIAEGERINSVEFYDNGVLIAYLRNERDPWPIAFITIRPWAEEDMSGVDPFSRRALVRR